MVNFKVLTGEHLFGELKVLTGECLFGELQGFNWGTSIW